MAEEGLEERLGKLEAEVLALRKTVSVLLFLLAGNGFAERDDLEQLAGILADELKARAAEAVPGSPERAAQEGAAPVVWELVEAALRPLSPDRDVHPPWPGRPQLAALESLVAALVVGALQGQPEREHSFTLLRRATLATAELRDWGSEEEAAAAALRADSKAEADRLLLGMAKALDIPVADGKEAPAAGQGGRAAPSDRQKR